MTLEPGSQEFRSKVTDRNLAKHTHEVFKEQARRDFKTGLPNERALDEFIQALNDNWVRSKEEGGISGTFLAFDADGLKRVNSMWGESTGDFYLKEISRAIIDSTRPGDRVFRLGEHSDTFLLHLPKVVDNETINNVVGRIDQQLAFSQSGADKEFRGIKMSVSKCAVIYRNKSPIMAKDLAINHLKDAKESEELRTGQRGSSVPMSIIEA